MAYASVDDVELRSRRKLSYEEKPLCSALLEDAAIIIDSFEANAPNNAKAVVSCNMVVRAIGGSDAYQFPIGAQQGTVSALGYSQTFSMGNGSTGELYLTKMEKKLLGVGGKIGFANQFGGEDD